MEKRREVGKMIKSYTKQLIDPVRVWALQLQEAGGDRKAAWGRKERT